MAERHVGGRYAPMKRRSKPIGSGARRRRRKEKKLQLHRLNNEADEDDERMIWICHPPKVTFSRDIPSPTASTEEFLP